MKTYLISDIARGIMSAYIEITASTPKKAAEKYLKCPAIRLYHIGGLTHNAEVTVREGRKDEEDDIFKFGAALFLYKKA